MMYAEMTETEQMALLREVFDTDGAKSILHFVARMLDETGRSLAEHNPGNSLSERYYAQAGSIQQALNTAAWGRQNMAATAASPAVKHGTMRERALAFAATQHYVTPKQVVEYMYKLDPKAVSTLQTVFTFSDESTVREVELLHAMRDGVDGK